jgi:hypothetical protein
MKRAFPPRQLKLSGIARLPQTTLKENEPRKLFQSFDYVMHKIKVRLLNSVQKIGIHGL